MLTGLLNGYLLLYAAFSIAGELLPDREVDCSIIYCTKHKIRDQG